MLTRTYKFRLYPTDKQKKLLNNSLETCRLVYNKVLETRKTAYEKDKTSISKFDCNKLITKWKENDEKIKSIHSQVLQNVSERVDLAYRGFFQRVKKQGEKAGFPRFKSFGRYDSMSYPGSGYKVINHELLEVSKIGKIKIKIHRTIDGNVKRLILKNEAGKWFACIQIEKDDYDTIERFKPVGVDLGISSFLTTSDNEKVENPKYFDNSRFKLAKIQRKYSKLKDLPKDDKKKLKVRTILQKIHCKIKNQRKDFMHKLSRNMVNNYSHICVEDLNIKKMLKDGYTTLARHISDCGWRDFLQMLDYKAEEAGSQIIYVNPAYTTQTCSKCGMIVKKQLSERIHKCNACGIELDRDYNASLNILRVGMDSLSNREVTLEAHSL
jgi:putative transposase